MLCTRWLSKAWEACQRTHHGPHRHMHHTMEAAGCAPHLQATTACAAEALEGTGQTPLPSRGPTSWRQRGVAPSSCQPDPRCPCPVPAPWLVGGSPTSLLLCAAFYHLGVAYHGASHACACRSDAPIAPADIDEQELDRCHLILRAWPCMRWAGTSWSRDR